MEIFLLFGEREKKERRLFEIKLNPIFFPISLCK
jgi:hypothetical protein